MGIEDGDAKAQVLCGSLKGSGQHEDNAIPHRVTKRACTAEGARGVCSRCAPGSDGRGTRMSVTGGIVSGGTGYGCPLRGGVVRSWGLTMCRA